MVEAEAETQDKAENIAQKQENKKPSTRNRASSKKAKIVVTSARRKMARARARLVPGSGRLLVNGKDVSTMQNKYLQSIVLEPINLSDITKQIASNSDIIVNVKGGGVSGQFQAARGAIAKAIVEASKDEVVKKLYLNYDRSLLIDDTRQVEPKKFKGPKARARFQKSYR